MKRELPKITTNPTNCDYDSIASVGVDHSIRFWMRG
jgi:hypothetical protein